MKTALFLTAIAVTLLCSLLASGAEPMTPYDNDPQILQILSQLENNTATLLPFEKNTEKHRGRRSNDYSMRMAYAPERETALYAGGNHNNGRYNDCWEYHLGSNSWHELFAAEGGDHYSLKANMMFEMRKVRRELNEGEQITLADIRGRLEERQRKLLAHNIQWWKEHAVLRHGMFTTHSGAPIMPSHTWDGLAYDPINQRLLWSAGAGTNGEPDLFHHFVTGMSLKKIQQQLDPEWTSMWAFDPTRQEWQRYREPEEGPCPDFRGMGQSLVYLPDREQFMWYIAASNVAPQSYQMWSYDPRENRWAELLPNEGQSIASLVKQGHAPGGEQVIRYSPRQGKLYAFRRNGVFTYDVESNQWKHVLNDDRFNAHDAHTAISYDSVNDVFLYARKQVEGSEVDFAAFDPAVGTWQVLTPQGEPLPKPQWQQYKGFFHPRHNVYVIALGNEPVWVYRYQQR